MDNHFDIFSAFDLDDIEADEDGRNLQPIDTNLDGISNTELIDIDNDGIMDGEHTLLDSDADGRIDAEIIRVDSDHDGVFDYEQIEWDFNLDEVTDLSQYTYTEHNQDGVIDTISFSTNTDKDGCIDVISIGQDLDGDGLIDLVIASQNALDFQDITAPIPNGEHQMDMVNFDSDNAETSLVVGDPKASMDSWHLQETDSSCAVAAQEFVLEDLLGQDFTEQELRDLATEHGWYDNGTPMEHVGDLLEAYGLQVDRHLNGTIEDITQCLDNGGNVIVGVDAGELWYGEDDVYGPGDDANHAVEVIGIDYSNPDETMVILNDSGIENGGGSMVPLNQFMQAWKDSDYFMVEATNL